MDVWIAGVKVRAFGKEDLLAGDIYPRYGSTHGNKYLYVPWLMSYENKKSGATAIVGIQKGLNLPRNDKPDLLIYRYAFGIPLWSAMEKFAKGGFATGGRVKPDWLKKIPYSSVIFYNIGADKDSSGEYHF